MFTSIQPIISRLQFRRSGLPFEKRAFGESSCKMGEEKKINKRAKRGSRKRLETKVPGINFDIFGISTQESIVTYVSLRDVSRRSVPVKMLTTRWKRTRALCTKRMAASQWCKHLLFFYFIFLTAWHARAFLLPRVAFFFLSRQSKAKRH